MLAWVVDHVASQTPRKERVALVLNGDVFDFLARPEASYFDVGAASQVRELAKRADIKPIFDALGRLVHTPRRTLVIAVGNHDIELALPSVQEALREILCSDDEAAAGRLVFSVDGTGYRCEVGGGGVLCVHGNATDDWNVVDHDELARRVFQEKASQPLDPWDANAGTRLVIDVMNPIKERYPFVDLLKPERKPVVGILSAFDESVRDKLARLPGILHKLARPAGVRPKVLGGTSPAADASVRSAPRWQTDGRTDGSDDGARRQLVERYLRDGIDPATVAGDARDTLFFSPRAWLDRRMGGDGASGLRVSLRDWLRDDETWSLDGPDAIYDELDRNVSSQLHVIAGHTHLARRRERSHGGKVYVNTGTWMLLARLEIDKHLKDDATFRPVLEKLRAGTIEALDQAGLLVRERFVAQATAGEQGGGDLMLRRVLVKPNGAFSLSERLGE